MCIGCKGGTVRLMEDAWGCLRMQKSSGGAWGGLKSDQHGMG